MHPSLEVKQQPTPPPDPLAAIRTRDPEALSAVVEDNARLLYRAARAWGLQPADAEDLVQDTFVTFLSGLDRFQGRSRVRTWLWGILRNKARAQRRRRAPLPLEGVVSETATTDYDTVEAREASQAILHCIHALTPRQRGAFWMREIEQRPAGEISRRLSMSANYCAVTLHRARLMLQDCLARAGWSGANS